MKITFTTPTTYVDGTAIPAADLAAAKYTVLIDTVSPPNPAKAYVVPAALIAAAPANADGSKNVSVDAVSDLKASLVKGTTYYLEAYDSISGSESGYTGIVSAVYAPIPGAPRNFSVA